jgi:hypothetical protein
LIFDWTAASVTFVGGVEVSNQSAVPEPRLESWMYCRTPPTIC